MSESFIGTITGALITFLAVMVSLRANQRTFEANLEEERKKLSDERSYSGKQKAFLAASVAVTRFVSYYITIPDRQLPQDGSPPNEVSEMSASLSALHFFCCTETIQKTTELSQTLNRCFCETLRLKVPAMLIDEKVKGIDIRINGLNETNGRIQQEILAMLSSDPSNPLIISYRKMSADTFQEIAQFHFQKTELSRQKYLHTEACRDSVINALPVVYVAMKDVLLMARQELGFPIEASDYSQIISDATTTGQESVKALLTHVRAQVEEAMA